MAALAVSSEKESPAAIDIASLSFQQLSHFRETLDQELEFFSQSMQHLKIAQQKFLDSAVSVERIKEVKQGQNILVPLTSSMYVPGQISNVDDVLIDIGTGYFVEKDTKAASDYYDRKVKYITGQMEKIQDLAKNKLRVRQAVQDTMENKLHAQLIQQRSASAAS